MQSLATIIHRSLQSLTNAIYRSLHSLATTVHRSLQSLTNAVHRSLQSLATAVHRSLQSLATAVDSHLQSLATAVHSPLQSLATAVDSSFQSLATAVHSPLQFLATSVHRPFHYYIRSWERFEISSSVLLGIQVFWHIAPCRGVRVCRRFGALSASNFEGSKKNVKTNPATQRYNLIGPSPCFQLFPLPPL